MNTNVIAFTGRNANRNTAPLSVMAAAGAEPTERTERTACCARRDNIVPMAGWRDRARPRRTPNGVFFTSHVLATTGFSA